MPVTAVVCVRNRAASIGACLAAIRAAGLTSVVVVDGRSTDGTVEIARASGAEVVSDGGAGLGAARAIGAAAVKTEWAAFVDSDTIVTPETFTGLLSAAATHQFDAVQAELKSSAKNPSYWQRGEIWRRRLQESPGRTGVLGCQATLIRTSLLTDVPFDYTFNGAAEDHDWCFRAASSGAILGHTDMAYALHEDRRSFGEFVRQRLWYGRGMSLMLLRYKRLAPQFASASTGLGRTPKWFPWLFVSWASTAVGMAQELTKILVFHRELLRTIRIVPGNQKI